MRPGCNVTEKDEEEVRDPDEVNPVEEGEMVDCFENGVKVWFVNEVLESREEVNVVAV